MALVLGPAVPCLDVAVSSQGVVAALTSDFELLGNNFKSFWQLKKENHWLLWLFGELFLQVELIEPSGWGTSWIWFTKCA